MKLQYFGMLFFFITWGCTLKENIKPELPEPTREGKNFLSAKIDNGIWISKDAVLGEAEIQKRRIFINAAFYKRKNRKSDWENAYLNVWINDSITTGRFLLGGISNNKITFSLVDIDSGTSTKLFETDSMNMGFFEIIYLNKEKKIISGIFSGTLKGRNANSRMIIEKGQYDLTYH